MRNPLNKRLPRELIKDCGKYSVVFLFMVLLISLVSGFLVADKSLQGSYDESFKKYNIEDGHITFNKKLPEDVLKTIEYSSNINLEPMEYKDIELQGKEATLRIYKIRKNVNKQEILKGKMPKESDEIALDRLFANHNNLKIGDKITLGNRKFNITATVALHDYSCLFEKNSDMMFDSVGFGAGVVTEKGYRNLPQVIERYNYSWTYKEKPKNLEEERNKSDELLDELGQVIGNYNRNIVRDQIDRLEDEAEVISANMKKEMIKGIFGDKSATAKADRLQDQLKVLQDRELDERDMISVSDYVIRSDNKAIQFAGEDIGNDKIMFIVFDYVVTAMLAFIFAITISGTISNESATIGTLRASGYTKGELIRHYMTLPVLVTIWAALIGNAIGYTLMKESMAKLYLDSYSLGKYKTVWSGEAFVLTTLVPIVLMVAINLTVLIRKLRLSPLKFIRHELSTGQSKISLPLSKTIPFIDRFRIRILIQNGAAYAVLFVGVVLAGSIAVFGSMFGPLLDDYSQLVAKSEIANYQYIVKDLDVETKVNEAEKYCAESLDTLTEKFITDSVTIYGIKENSRYVRKKLPGGEVLLSNGYMEKYGYEKGDTIELKDPYSEDTYEFKVAGQYDYDAAIAVFMNEEYFKETFNKSPDYFTGYFSNTKLTDIDQKDIVTVITEEDLMKIATQLRISMGNFMDYMKYFAIILFMLMMYILTKHVIEKNSLSISMTKILGYTNGEIARLYLLLTSLVVILYLLVSIPIIHLFLYWMFKSRIYTMMTGYIPFIISYKCYIEMFTMGIVSYGFVSVFLLMKINRIPKTYAIKTLE